MLYCVVHKMLIRVTVCLAWLVQLNVCLLANAFSNFKCTQCMAPVIGKKILSCGNGRNALFLQSWMQNKTEKSHTLLVLEVLNVN